MPSTFVKDGFAIIDGVLNADALSALLSHLETDQQSAKRRGGLRNLLDDPCMFALAESQAVRKLVEPILGPAAFPVRGILFDKTAEANWKVPWHQDVTIAVRERVDTADYGPWSTKQGVVHVQPPASTLEQMLTVRLHLDDCDAANGALRVLAGTHLQGRIGESIISEMAQQLPGTLCEVRAGGALLMRPLLIHASSAATTPRHRRVLHFDFAAHPLPGGLTWAAKQKHVHPQSWKIVSKFV